MRQDHPLGIDAFVSQACKLSPHVNPIQALQLLQECIKIMPQTGGNGRPIGRPGWFLLSISESFFIFMPALPKLSDIYFEVGSKK